MNMISHPKSIKFAKNIRLNLNSKFLPQNFFPQSISQYSKSRKNQKSTFFLSTPESPQNDKISSNQQYSAEELKNINFLKKRLIKIKQSASGSSEQKNKNKSLKKHLLPRKCQRALSMKEGKSQITKIEQNQKSKKCSRKMLDYMLKMKNVINIDIKFQQDFISPTNHKRPTQQKKQNCDDDVQTDDSPKLQRFRPKSEFRNRKKNLFNQSGKIQFGNLRPETLKMKRKQAKTLMETFQEEENIKIKNRYDKFGDLQINDEGMLTFYGSFNQNSQQYDSKKYSTRTSLPKLQN